MLWRNKKDISIFRMKKVPYLLLWMSSVEDHIHTHIDGVELSLFVYGIPSCLFIYLYTLFTEGKYI